MGRFVEAARLAVGAALHAALHARRADYKRGAWTPFVTGFAEASGVTTRTLGDWMVAAERHYGLELPKAAKPTRQGAIGGSANSAIDAEATPKPSVSDTDTSPTRKETPIVNQRDDGGVGQYRGMPRRRTPQQKKALARDRDVVDSWGESQKSFRRKKPLRKAQVTRAHRRVVSLALRDGRDPGEVSRKRLRFWTGPRLGDQIDWKLSRRAALQESPRRSPEARSRRRLRRGQRSD